MGQISDCSSSLNSTTQDPSWLVVVRTSHGEVRHQLRSFAQLGNILYTVEDKKDAKIYLLRTSYTVKLSRDDWTRAERHTFYVQKQSTTVLGGNGSRLRPWWGMDSAIEGLYDMWASNRLTVKENDGLLLRYQEVFSAIVRSKYRFWTNHIYHGLCGLCTALLIIPTCLFLIYMVYRAWPLLTWNFLVTNPKGFMLEGGILSPLIGTFAFVFLTLLISAPFGILAGIYLNEYAGDNRWTRLINLAVLNLAGVPSIIYALVGLGFFVWTFNMGISMFTAACTVSVMSLPVIITCTREALATVPKSFRVSCWHRGATRWQTIRTIVLPNAMSGILTGIILQVARVAGETVPVWLTGAVFYSPLINRSPLGISPFPDFIHEPLMTLSTHLYILFTQSFEVSESRLYAIGAVLIGLILLINSWMILLRIRLRTHRQW